MSRKKHRAMRSATSEQCDNVSDRGVTWTPQIDFRFKIEYALIAQSVEHAAVNRGVTGSSPVWGAIQYKSEPSANR